MKCFSEKKDMHDFYVEQRSINGKTLLSWDLAHHLYAHGTQGKVVIVCEKPTDLLSTMKKQWLKLMRQAQRERASTLNAIRIYELTRQISWMQQLTFSAKFADDLVGIGVALATTEDLLRVPPVCSALYITYPIEKEKLYMLTAWMPKRAAVVLYA